MKKAIPAKARLIILDETGSQFTSREFAKTLEKWTSDSKELVFAIGGADGFDGELRNRADALLSLGKMTFAHRLARLILSEQLYRAVSILQGSPYHRD